MLSSPCRIEVLLFEIIEAVIYLAILWTFRLRNFSPYYSLDAAGSDEEEERPEICLFRPPGNAGAQSIAVPVTEDMFDVALREASARVAYYKAASRAVMLAEDAAVGADDEDGAEGAAEPGLAEEDGGVLVFAPAGLASRVLNEAAADSAGRFDDSDGGFAFAGGDTDARASAGASAGASAAAGACAEESADAGKSTGACAEESADAGKSTGADAGASTTLAAKSAADGVAGAFLSASAAGSGPVKDAAGASAPVVAWDNSGLPSYDAVVEAMATTVWSTSAGAAATASAGDVSGDDSGDESGDLSRKVDESSL